ncbi:MAG TPA: ABC transporter ATP-binding protein [Planctomycetaceae bacterium]|nr:ABC transporter ATP-binding protein [Planctomycetaceae bacterium]
MFIKQIWGVLESDRRLIVLSIFCGLLFTGLGILPPLLVREMLLWLQPGSQPGSFTMLALLAASIYVARGAMRYCYGLASHIAAYNTLHRLTNRVYAHLQTMSPSYLNRRHSGNLVARSIGDVDAIEDFIAHGIPETVLAMVIPTTMSVVLLIINWQLALVALLPLPLLAIVMYILRKRTRNYWGHVRKQFATVSALMSDFLNGIKVIQTFQAYKVTAARLQFQSKDYRDKIVHANKWSLVPAGVVEVFSGAGIVCVICAGSWMVTVGSHTQLQVSIPDLVVFLMYLGQIFLPFLRLATMTDHIQKAAASAARVFELLEAKADIVDAADARVPVDPCYDITFDNVEFSYQEGESVLAGTTFSIAENEIVALVGETGVGKSTACQLLVRFHDVTQGAVRVGGVDVRELPLDYLRRQIAMVPQEMFLFEGSIRENLLIGKEDATEAELLEAIKQADAIEFVESFVDGLDTIVGERGVRLSGGQKQRVGIARALLKDAPILVLDEATSAVDVETEAAIRQAIQRAATGRTVLIVAHRLATIKTASRIVVLDKGKVVEQGTFAELVEKQGVFCRIYQV